MRARRSEPEAGEAAGLGAEGDDRRRRDDAVDVPRRWTLGGRVERGRDPRPGSGRARPASPAPPSRRRPVRDPRRRSPARPGLRRRRRRRASTRRRAARVPLDVGVLAGAGTGLEPEHGVQPERADSRDVRAPVLVERGEPGGPGVVVVRRRRVPRVQDAVIRPQSTGGSPSATPRLMVSMAASSIGRRSGRAGAQTAARTGLLRLGHPRRSSRAGRAADGASVVGSGP